MTENLGQPNRPSFGRRSALIVGGTALWAINSYAAGTAIGRALTNDNEATIDDNLGVAYSIITENPVLDTPLRVEVAQAMADELLQGPEQEPLVTILPAAGGAPPRAEVLSPILARDEAVEAANNPSQRERAGVLAIAAIEGSAVLLAVKARSRRPPIMRDTRIALPERQPAGTTPKPPADEKGPSLTERLRANRDLSARAQRSRPTEGSGVGASQNDLVGEIAPSIWSLRRKKD